jgi:hypothetical protein
MAGAVVAIAVLVVAVLAPTASTAPAAPKRTPLFVTVLTPPAPVQTPCKTESSPGCGVRAVALISSVKMVGAHAAASSATSCSDLEERDASDCLS